MTGPLIEPTDEMVKAFAVAAGWPEPPDNPGVDVTRGMTAVFELLARDYDIRPRQAAEQCPRCYSPYPNHRFALPVQAGPQVEFCTDPWHNAATADTAPADVPHYCGNCEGVDPASCINTNGQVPPAGPPPFDVQIKGLPVGPLSDTDGTQCPTCTSPYRHHRFALADPDGDGPAWCDDEWHDADPGDGRVECDPCGRFVWPADHRCKGAPVTAAAKARWDAAHPEASRGRHADD